MSIFTNEMDSWALLSFSNIGEIFLRAKKRTSDNRISSKIVNLWLLDKRVGKTNVHDVWRGAIA